jgi:phosphonate transport system substrate-binding protein
MVEDQPTRIARRNCSLGRSVAIALIVSVALAGVQARAQCSSLASYAQLAPTPINIIVNEQILAVANRSDVVGAMQVWGELTSCIVKLNIETKVDVVGSQTEIRRRILDSKVDLLVLDSMQFTKLSDAGLLDGVAVTSNAGHPSLYTYLLLVDQQTTSLAQLHSKRAVFYATTGSSASLAWMATLLAKEHLGKIETFFGPSEISNKATSCILPLFFGRVQACIISRLDWDLVKEMNPQLGSKIKILAESRPVLESVTAMPKRLIPHRQQIIDSLLTMHNYPAGNQILSLVKSGPMIPYRPEYIESTRLFWEEYVLTLTPAERLVRNDSEQSIVPKQFGQTNGVLNNFEAIH